MAAFNTDGQVVAVKDFVTIIGKVTAVSGSGGTATVTVLPNLTTSTFNAQANDMQAPEGPNDASHAATSISGNFFGTNDNVSVLGFVTAISGSGNTASLTVKLCTSGLSITCPAGSVHSVQFNG